MASGDLGSVTAQFIQLVPVNQAAVPPGCFFLDAANANKPSLKAMDASTQQVTTSVSSGINYFVKNMVASGAIGAGLPLGKRNDGKVVPGDSDGTAAQQNFCGYSLTATAGDGEIISVLCAGPNIKGAIAGLGFAPGDELYLSQTQGYTNDASTLTDGNDSYIKLGIADCAEGTASAVAVDLIAFAAVISRV